MRCKYWAGIAASIVLGLIFAISGSGKLPVQDEFLKILLTTSFFHPVLVHIAAHYLPWAELILGLLLIIGVATKIMSSFCAVLILAFIANNSWLIFHGQGYEPCGCLGILDRLIEGNLSTMQSLYLDIGMLALVVIILLSHPGSFLTIRPWFFEEARIGGDEGGT